LTHFDDESPTWIRNVSQTNLRPSITDKFTFHSGMVYDDAEKLYAEVRHDGEALLEEAFDVLFPISVSLSLSTPTKKLKGPGDIIAFNTTFFPRRDVVELPLIGSLKTKFSAMSTKENVVQASNDGRVGYVLMDCAQGRSVGAPFAISGGLSADYLPASGSSFHSVSSARSF
jgi:alpha-mannosidase